ncbi:TLC domain-containing protein [Tribonema minus]|uniref:TLC domain-containing protein n=1 Tax=Tribonema minus TaxID=303371 RepID=A0A835YYL5_9STRA|nr:TLC domain-containing protein [Tribonema minus]
MVDALELSMENPTFVWLLFLTTCQIFTQVVASKRGPFVSDPALFAHQVCAFFATCAIGGYGTYYWYTEANDVHDRLYDVMVGAPVVTHINLAFQIFDFFATLLIADLRKPEMVVHHTLAVLLAFFVLRDAYGHYYACFFLGMTEVSAIPLCIVDVFKHFRGFAAQHDGINTLMRVLFAFSFLIIRGIYWPTVSYRYFMDTAACLQKGTCHNNAMAIFFSVSNVLLTLLQWYWASLIVRALVKMAKSGNNVKKDVESSKDTKAN